METLILFCFSFHNYYKIIIKHMEMSIQGLCNFAYKKKKQSKPSLQANDMCTRNVEQYKNINWFTI